MSILLIISFKLCFCSLISNLFFVFFFYRKDAPRRSKRKELFFIVVMKEGVKTRKMKSIIRYFLINKCRYGLFFIVFRSLSNGKHK